MGRKSKMYHMLGTAALMASGTQFCPQDSGQDMAYPADAAIQEDAKPGPQTSQDARSGTAKLEPTDIIQEARDYVHRVAMVRIQEQQELSERAVKANPGMRCPACSCPASRVTKTMAAWGGIRRYRECFDCGRSWATLEPHPQMDP